MSAFNSRLRQGQPRHNSPWSPREKIAFGRFKTPNHLAEALGSWNPFRRRAAREAMNAIKHCRLAYTFYLDSVGVLRKQKDRIAFIGEQEHLDSDFERLKALMKIGPEVTLPTDDVSAHKSPAGLSTYLSPKARKNLRRFYRKDYKIYKWCKAHKQKMLLAQEQGEKSAERATAE